MSNLAQEEADRYFTQKEHHTSHPEDRHEQEDSLSTHSSEGREQPPPQEEDDDNDDEESLRSNNMSTTTAGYHVPFRRFDANTGPKGVIADAQSFNRAKQSTFRKTLNNFSNAVSRPLKTQPSNSKLSHSGSEESEEDEGFMRQWRQNRLQELHAQHSSTSQIRRQSPSQRTWGSLQVVDANGYLDAIERVAEDVVVVVCVYDPKSTASAEVEDVLGTIAYKHSTTRFVKLHHEIAEMNHVVVPGLLAYRGGEVFATISEARPEGLETALRRVGVLN